MKQEYDMKKAKRGAIINTPGKTRVTLYIDNEILKNYRERAEKQGKGYQTLVNDALRESLKDEQVDSVKTLRKVIREELKKYGTHD